MSQITMEEQYLREKGALVPQIPAIVQDAVACINTKAKHKMKIAIAISELTTFASHLRKPIQFDPKSIVTTNMISTILARSGDAKDSSVNAVRIALKSGYDTIKAKRESDAKLLAQEKALASGDELENYYKYLRVLRPLMPELGTLQGMTQHFAMLAEGSVGAGYISTSEVGSDLLSNKDMPLILTLLAKSYDLGNIPATIVKDDLNQVGEITGFPVSALMFGTESVILYEPKVKEQFKQAFTAQLARRGNFSFNPEPTPITTYSSMEAKFDAEEDIKQTTLTAQDVLSKRIDNLVVSTTTKPLTLSQSTVRLFDTYLTYNEQQSELVPKMYPISEIARKHYQWRALKLSAVYAIYDLSSTIEPHHYVAAINTLEIFANDLMLFERELIKESYEQFADFMHTIAEHGKAFLSIHNLRKLGYVSSSAEARLNELAKSATSYDVNGIYTASKDGIYYEGLTPVSTQETELGAFNTSYLEIRDDMSAKFLAIYALPAAKQKKAKDDYKQYLGSIIKSGYQNVSSSFADISIAMSTNCAISNYIFEGGVRLKENLINSTNWLLFDIDTSTLSIDSVHFILQDINHHLVRGSDDNNNYKYHLAVELDSTLEIEPRLWKHFMKSVASYLGVQHDPLPQAQVLFCYGGREVLSVTDKSPLEIKDHILFAAAQVTTGPVKELTDGEKKKLLENSFGTFQYAFECVDNGSRNLIRAAYHARELGLPTDSIVALLQEINEYWEIPMDQQRLENTLLSQVRAW